MTIYLPELSAHDLSFPPLSDALTNPDGLLAMGGDLSAPRLLHAYSQAIFPWFSEGDPLLWWSPSTRALFKPNTLMLNRSLKKQINRESLRFSVNMAFADVIKNCAAPRAKQRSTWILPSIQRAYIDLHKLGYAHSIEVWQQDKLVGGLYGVLVGSLFCGESMFNKTPNTAKLALVTLQQHLQKVSSGWIDCQIPNPFLMQLGATTISRNSYSALLNEEREKRIEPAHWQSQYIDIKAANV